MTVIVDTAILYADHDRDAGRHEEASHILEDVYDGKYGAPYVSDYIYDEAVTLTLKRGASFEAAKHLGQKIRGAGPYPRVYELLRVTAAVFNNAVDVFEQYNDHGLSFTDATTVALVKRHNIDHVLSFDDDFDGVVNRLSPWKRS